MTLASAASVATIIGATATMIALLAVLLQLRHLRAANFTTAWSEISRGLQTDKVQVGRAICRQLNKKNTGHSLQTHFPADWQDIATALQPDFDTHRQANSPAQCISSVSAAYDAFDTAAILAWHSRVPGLWRTVVSEYEDGIINTWEAGAPLLRERKERSRAELFECFSALYISALRHRTVGRGLYPFCGLIQKLRLFTSLPGWFLARKAKKHRDEVFRANHVERTLASH